MGSCHLNGISISGGICRKLLLFLTRMGVIAVVWVTKKIYTTIIVLHNAQCVFNEKLYFLPFHASMDSTRCCKHFSETVGPHWLQSDAFIHSAIDTFHIIPKVLCLVEIWRVHKLWEENRGHCLFPTLQWCLHVKWHLISLYVPIWIVNSDHEGYIPTPCMSHRTPGFLRSRFIFPPLSHALLGRTYMVSFSCSSLTGVESGIALCCSSPSNSRLNDVCFLKCPSSHCCCTELSFICGLLTWASFAIVLWLLSWVTDVPILRSDILRSQSA